MGTWGPGIYQDDVTCDIKGDYLNRLRVGYSNEEAVGRAVKQNDEEWMLFLYEFAENNNIIESEFENKELFKIIEDYYTSLN